MDEKETRSLPVKLTQDEVRVKGKELSKNLGEIQTLKNSLKRITDDTNAQLKKLGLDSVNLQRMVDDEIEYRQVECVDRNNYDRFQVETYRCDTMELVFSRNMTPNERQLVMFPTAKLKAVNDTPQSVNEIQEVKADEAAAAQDASATGIPEAVAGEKNRKKSRRDVQ